MAMRAGLELPARLIHFRPKNGSVDPGGLHSGALSCPARAALKAWQADRSYSQLARPYRRAARRPDAGSGFWRFGALFSCFWAA
jgi:hypothetical protein